MWARIEDTLWSDPKTARVPLAALGLLSLLTSYGAQHLTGGFITRAVTDRFFPYPVELAQLVTVGLLHAPDGEDECRCLDADQIDHGPHDPTDWAYYIHEYQQRNPRRDRGDR